MSLENVRIFAVPLEKIAGFFTEFIEKTERKYKKQVPRKDNRSRASISRQRARNIRIYKEEFDPGSG